MSWGTTIKDVTIYVNRTDLSNIYRINELIEEEEDMLERAKEELLLLIGSPFIVNDESDDDKSSLSDVSFKFRELWETINDSISTITELRTYKRIIEENKDCEIIVE